MKHTFVLASKPFSINSAYYKGGYIKSHDNIEWTAQIFHQLSTVDNLKKLKELREYFNENEHSFKLHIKAIYPKKIYITKQNIISSKTIDLTNFEKLLVDLFFDKQYFEKPYPYGVQNINHNDKHIISMFSEKSFHDSDDFKLIFTVKIVKKNF